MLWLVCSSQIRQYLYKLLVEICSDHLHKRSPMVRDPT